MAVCGASASSIDLFIDIVRGSPAKVVESDLVCV